MKKVFIIIFTLLVIALFWIGSVWSSEEILAEDVMYTSLTGLEDHLINQVTLHYNWDDDIAGSTTHKVMVSARVE